MELADFLTKELVITDLKASDRWEAIEELIDLLVDKGRIKSEHRDAIVSIVKKRETKHEGSKREGACGGTADEGVTEDWMDKTHHRRGLRVAWGVPEGRG